MPDKKITELDAYTPPIDTDVLPIVDVTTNSTKKITWTSIKAALKTYFDSLYPTSKAIGSELDTGTDDSKYVTAKAIKDSNNVPSVAPSTSGNLLTSNGTKWTSAAPPVSVSVTTKGDLQTYSTTPARLPVGTDGQILEARASETTGLKWIAAPTKATGTEVDAGTDDVKFVTSKAMEDSSYAKTSSIPVKATATEIAAGTDDAKFATALSLVPMMNYSMARQAIINGNFDVWQRGTSGTTFTDATALWLADRWYDIADDDGGTKPTITRSRQILTSGDIANAFYHTRLSMNGTGTSLGNNSYHTLNQKIEFGTRMLCGDGKKVTVSFWARSDIANKRICPTFIQNYGTGGSPSTAEVLQGTPITLTSTWTKYTQTFITNTLVGKTFGTDNNDYLGLFMYHQWGSTCGNTYVQTGVSAETYGNGYIDIAQVQLCAGDVALPFQPKSFWAELEECQRYYEKSFEYNTAPAQNVSSYGGAPWWSQITAGATQTCYYVPFKVKKRVIPTTVTLYNPVAANAQVRNFDKGSDCTGSVTNHANGQWGFTILATNVSGAAAGNLNVVHWTADSEL